MNLKWGTVILYIGIALILQSSRCDAGSRVAVSDPQTLAKQTGAAHFEEHYEPIESSEESSEHRLRKRASDEDFDYEVYQGVVGRPGIDFPIHARIPQTSFSCRQYGNGYFADLETDCQVFHICDDGRKISFLCPNGTIFQQTELICDWWFKVNCGKSPGFYADSAELLSRSSGRRKNHQRIENDYSSDKKNGFRSSYKSKGNKSQYPLKSSRRYEESDRLNQAKQTDRRIDSEESVSVESIDFEDITEGTRTYHRKSDKFQVSKPSRDNDNESQVLAETASFVGNNGRDNGYTYDIPSSNKKSQVSSSERGYSREVANQQQRQKNDRGRQKYDFRSNVYKNLNQPKQSERLVEASTTTTTAEPHVFESNRNSAEAYQTTGNNGNNDEIFQRNGYDDGSYHKNGYNGNNGSGYQYSANNGNGNGNNGNNNNGNNNGNKGTFFDRSQSRFSTPRPNGGYTTARRIDITKTTPYYTPTVPTVARFGEYKSAPTSTTVKTGFTPIISTPNPFSQRKGQNQPQSSDRFNFGSQNDYSFQKPSSFRAPPSTTAAPIRTTYYTSDGRRPAVDIRLINGTVTSTPAYFSTTQQSPVFTTSGYDYSPFSTVPPNSGDRTQTKLSSPAPFSVFASGERTSSPVDVIIENRFESKKQNPNLSGFSTPFTPSRTENIEILKKDNPTKHDVKIETTTGLPVETITNNYFSPAGNNEIEKLVATSGYAYDTPSTPGLITSTNNYGYSTVSNDFTTTATPTASTPPKPEAESDAVDAFDFKRNTVKNVLGVDRIETTTTAPQQRTTGGYSTQGFATSTYSPPISTYFPSSLPTPTSTVAPSQSTTVLPDNPPPTTYRPSITTAQPSVVDHVKSMIKTLNDLNVPVKVGSRAGLDIPSSSGPDTLHSLAEYFASEESTSTTETNALADENRSGDHESEEVAVKADLLGSNLTGKTVHRYKNLFGLSTTTTSPEPTIIPRFQPEIAAETVDLEGQHSSGLLGDSVGKPETRKLAQVFTNALSAYLQDPESFRKVLTEVRPTEPPTTVDAEFNQGTAASYLPTGSTSVTTSSPASRATTLRTSEGLEVLDYSDVTGTPGSPTESSTFASTTSANDISTTQDPISNNPFSVTVIPNYVNKVPASMFIAESLRKKTLQLEANAKLQTGTEANVFPDEINTGLGLSTVEPYLSLAESIAARKSAVEFGTSKSVFSTTERDGNQADSSTTTLPPASVAFELLPPSAESDFNFEDDEEALQRAQSQSFVTARNNLNRIDGKGKLFESLKLSSTIAPRTDSNKQFHFITRLMTDSPTTTEVPDYKKGTVTPWPATTAFSGFLDPLTINDGLTVRAEVGTTTASPHTYLPRSTPLHPAPMHVDVEDLGQSGASTIRAFLHPDIPEEVLPPANGIQRIANKMFGNLDIDSATHLMRVMKKAESNETVRKLILLLIQTCDEDYGNTVEQSRKILLNALIGMDQKLSGNEEVKVFKLQPGRESKSIDYSSPSQKLTVSTVQPPVSTTFQSAISTTLDYESASTAHSNSGEETTKPLIHVEDPGEGHHASTFKPFESESSTIASTPEPIAYNTTESFKGSPTTLPPQNNRRRTKDINDSLGLPGAESDLSHKSSDERALELLKSLYSLASKFSRR